MPIATTGIPCVIEPWLAGCGGLAEAWPWLIGLGVVVALPVLASCSCCVAVTGSAC